MAMKIKTADIPTIGVGGEFPMKRTADCDDYMSLAMRTEPTEYLKLPVHERLNHGVQGCVTEAGELTDALKRFIHYGTDIDRVNILEECGDMLWYLAIILDSIGSNFAEAQAVNIAKLRKRFPDKFTQADAVDRDLGEERKALEGGAS